MSCQKRISLPLVGLGVLISGCCVFSVLPIHDFDYEFALLAYQDRHGSVIAFESDLEHLLAASVDSIPDHEFLIGTVDPAQKYSPPTPWERCYLIGTAAWREAVGKDASLQGTREVPFGQSYFKDYSFDWKIDKDIVTVTGVSTRGPKKLTMRTVYKVKGNNYSVLERKFIWHRGFFESIFDN